MNYGLNYYSHTIIGESGKKSQIELPVKEGTLGSTTVSFQWAERNMLMREGEKISIEIGLPKQITAPINKGAIVGSVTLYLQNEPIMMIPAILNEDVDAFTFLHCFEHIFAYSFDISR